MCLGSFLVLQDSISLTCTCFSLYQQCTGTCYNSNESIKSLKAVGDGTYGTNCVLYSGFNCQDPSQVGQTGNIITGGGKCYSNGNGGNSFRCWRKC